MRGRANLNGIRCVGVPIGSLNFVQQFVATKASDIIADVEKVRMVSDPVIHFHLLRSCESTCLAYLDRSDPPVMVAGPCSIQHVSDAAVLRIIFGSLLACKIALDAVPLRFLS